MVLRLKNKGLWIYLCLYAAIVLTANALIDFNIANGYARSVSAAYIADSIKAGDLSYEHFLEGEYHYKIFSGIADWEPLQLIVLTGSFLIIGTSKWAYIIPSLLITLSALAYIYYLVLQAYPKRKDNALITVITVSLTFMFFLGAGVPTLENGLILFTVATIYHFIKWTNTEKDKQFYIMMTFFSLGCLWKSIMVLVIPALMLLFYYRKNRKKLFKTKLIIVGTILFLIIMSPLVVRELMLKEHGINQANERTIGKLHNLLPQEANVKGYINAWDMEFQTKLTPQQEELVNKRYELSYLQKFFIALSSFACIAWLIPQVLVSAHKTEAEKAIIIFVATNIIFFGMFGLIPRYMIPAVILATILIVMTIDLDWKLSTVLILATITVTSLAVKKVVTNEHVQAKQYPYEETVLYTLTNVEGNFTIETFRPYPMAFYLYKHDTEKRGSIRFIDGNKQWNDSFSYEIQRIYGE